MLFGKRGFTGVPAESLVANRETDRALRTPSSRTFHANPEISSGKRLVVIIQKQNLCITNFELATQHFDAFDLGNEDGRRVASNGGQRVVTVLVYLNVDIGGATAFPALNLQVQPRRGMALVFFPATVDGLLDRMALHAALPALEMKYVSQVWIRQSTYAGQPTKRFPQILG